MNFDLRRRRVFGEVGEEAANDGGDDMLDVNSRFSCSLKNGHASVIREARGSGVEWFSGHLRKDVAVSINGSMSYAAKYETPQSGKMFDDFSYIYLQSSLGVMRVNVREHRGTRYWS